ncbi:MAG: hypothetical protein WBG50_09360 [Desulfomonilaceae bacterium]
MNDKTRNFLADLREGMSSGELMSKYNLSPKRLEQILVRLRRSDLAALRQLWERNKLTDTQFMRAFSELETDLDSDDS